VMLMALLYADEDFPLGAVQILRNLGYDVLTVQETGRCGKPDPDVLADATADGRAVLTHNHRDFQRLVEAGARYQWRPTVDLVETLRERKDADEIGRIERAAGVATQALTRTLQLDARVTCHGFQPTDQLAAFYARAHLHVVSSRHEAAGVVVLEAAAAGLATVGTAVGYVADWTPDRAVAVPVSDPNALAAAIVELLQDPARRARIASAAREWTLAHDADWTAAQFEGIYKM